MTKTPNAGLTAFVTDGNERPALAITRSLGRRGFRVLVGAEGPVSLASASRYCVRHVTYPSPSRFPAGFERFLRDFVAHERVDVVVPVTDITTQMIAADRRALAPHTAVAAPPLEAFEQMTNKAALLRRAAACGIAVPRTHVVESCAHLKTIIRRVEYPAVIKPARSRVRTGTGWLSASVQYAHSEAELRHLYRTTDYLAWHPSLIQERIVGPGIGVFVLCDHGRVRGAFAHRRLREKPPSGGASVLCESLPVDPGLLDEAARLLGPLGWHGVAMLEYKQDRRSGTPYLMEVNGRFWGSLQLAIDAGIDFPYFCAQLALGQSPDVPASHKVGIRSRWLLGDLDHLLLRVCQSGDDLPEGAPSRLRTVAEFVTPRAQLRHEVFRPDDPRPALHELREYTKSLRIRAFVRRQVARVRATVRPGPAIPSTIHERGKNAGALI